MKPDWADGYVSEIGYTYGFYRELTPALIQFTLLSNGYMPPALDGPYTYCELGFGQGVSTNLLAASNPRGSFWGTDFNPEQAAFAREVAEQSRNNATLLDDSFAEFLARDTPLFDFIVLHGTWSWVSAEAQQSITDILRHKLKIGGAVYISYNVLPGWTQEMPMRDLMMLHTELGSPAGTGITTRIEDAIGFVDALNSNGARFFNANPQIGNFLRDLKSDDRHYLAHEYFNKSWDLIYFSDLARQLESAKLGFACSAHQMDLLDVLAHRGQISKVLAKIDNPILREVARDFALNRRFRRDIFVRGARRLSASERIECMLDVCFMLQTSAAEIPTKTCGPENEVPMDEALYGPLVEVLASTAGTPRPLREIAADRRLAHVSKEQLLQAIRILVGLRHLHPVFAADVTMRKQAHTKRFNEAMSNQARHHNNMKYLASPVLTGGVSINRFQLLFLLARQQKLQSAEEWAKFAFQTTSVQDQRLRVQGKIIDDPEERLAEFRKRAQKFSEDELPMLQAFGVA